MLVRPIRFHVSGLKSLSLSVRIPSSGSTLCLRFCAPLFVDVAHASFKSTRLNPGFLVSSHDDYPPLRLLPWLSLTSQALASK